MDYKCISCISLCLSITNLVITRLQVVLADSELFVSRFRLHPVFPVPANILFRCDLIFDSESVHFYIVILQSPAILCNIMMKKSYDCFYFSIPHVGPR